MPGQAVEPDFLREMASPARRQVAPNLHAFTVNEPLRSVWRLAGVEPGARSTQADPRQRHSEPESVRSGPAGEVSLQPKAAAGRITGDRQAGYPRGCGAASRGAHPRRRERGHPSAPSGRRRRKPRSGRGVRRHWRGVAGRSGRGHRGRARHAATSGAALGRAQVARRSAPRRSAENHPTGRRPLPCP